MAETNGEDSQDQPLERLQEILMEEIGRFVKHHPDVQPARVGAIVGQIYLAHYVASYGDDACKAARETLELIIEDFERPAGKFKIH